MTWERRVGQNIRGFLEGGDPTLRDELVVLTAYYDSMSVVPAMSPGGRSSPAASQPSWNSHASLVNPSIAQDYSVLFVAVVMDISKGLQGSRAFYGRGSDRISSGSATDSPGTPTMHGLRRGLSTDIIEFEEFGQTAVILY